MREHLLIDKTRTLLGIECLKKEWMRSLGYSSLPPSETHPRIRSFVTANAILFCLNFVSLLKLVRYICTYIYRGIGVQNDEKT